MDIVNFLQPSFWIKIITLIVIASYVIFTLVVYTQVKAMSRIIRIFHHENLLKMVAVIQIILAVSLFIFAIAIL
jgi:hypothetical protein